MILNQAVSLLSYTAYKYCGPRCPQVKEERRVGRSSVGSSLALMDMTDGIVGIVIVYIGARPILKLAVECTFIYIWRLQYSSLDLFKPNRLTIF